MGEFTSFIKFDGITTLNFEKDFEPVVRLRSSNGVNYNAAHITCKGTVKGTIRGSLKAEFKAAGFSFGSETKTCSNCV